HHAEHEPGLFFLGHECGDDGVERPLMRLQPIEMIGIQRKQRAAILQSKSQVSWYQAGAESGVVALYQRNTVSILVDDTEIDRIALSQFGISRLHVGKSLLQVNECAPLSSVWLGNE